METKLTHTRLELDDCSQIRSLGLVKTKLSGHPDKWRNGIDYEVHLNTGEATIVLWDSENKEQARKMYGKLLEVLSEIGESPSAAAGPTKESRK